MCFAIAKITNAAKTQLGVPSSLSDLTPQFAPNPR